MSSSNRTRDRTGNGTDRTRNRTRTTYQIEARDSHHIIPKVRCRELGIPNNFRGNIKKISTAKHRAWHTLFGAATPDEAIEIIKHEWSLSETAAAEFQKLCGNVSLLRRRK